MRHDEHRHVPGRGDSLGRRTPAAASVALICALEALLFVGVLLGLVGMMVAGPGALLATLAMIWLVVGIARGG